MSDKIQITFNRLIVKSKDTYFGFCPELNVAVTSQSPEAATKALIDGVQELLEIAKKDRQLEILLQEAGYIKNNNEWAPPAVQETGTGKVTL